MLVTRPCAHIATPCNSIPPNRTVRGPTRTSSATLPRNTEELTMTTSNSGPDSNPNSVGVMPRSSAMLMCGSADTPVFSSMYRKLSRKRVACVARLVSVSVDSAATSARSQPLSASARRPSCPSSATSGVCSPVTSGECSSSRIATL